jgi:uroporphyrinogen decarboxylase
MTERERFIKALKRERVDGHVPTAELAFYLTMEAIGKVCSMQRTFPQWGQTSAREKEVQLRDMARCNIEIVQKYHHSAIFAGQNPGDLESVVRFLQIIREESGMEYFIILQADPTCRIPNGDGMIDFSARLYEDPQGIIAEQEARMVKYLEFAEKLKQYDGGALVDGYALCADYCFNANPFYPPELFAEVIAPVLKKTIEGFRSLGIYTIKHTDGNIMPIIDQLVQCKPDALHSLDPQGGVSLKTVKEKYGGQVCLMGNVNCGLLQTGIEEEVIADVRRALRDGMPGGGYIFSTSNCVYTGLALSRYELMNKIWFEEGVYP